MQLNRLKPYYIALCLFFVVGAFVTAYVNGQQVENLPDTRWQTPDYFVGFLNNCLNQKVNPLTLGDILVTEYLEHPPEPTGVLALYPTQAVVQERKLVNCTITELETFIVMNDESTVRTPIGIGFYTRHGNGNWRLEKYDTIRTTTQTDQTLKIVIETPLIVFGRDGGAVRIVITNFGTGIDEVVYIPTIVDTSERSSFSGINTIVEADEALFLTIKNRFQIKRGHLYYVDYKPYTGLQLHRLTYKLDEERNVALHSNEIIALFDYPTLKRKDSFTDRYSLYETLLDRFFPSINPKLVSYCEDILIQIPVIGSLFKFTLTEAFTPFLDATSIIHSNENILDFVDGLVTSAQNDFQYAAQPAIQTMLLTEKITPSHPNGYYELMDRLNSTFVSDYNEFERYTEFTFTRLNYKTYKLEVTGQKQVQWIFDLTKSIDDMITEKNRLEDHDIAIGYTARRP